MNADMCKFADVLQSYMQHEYNQTSDLNLETSSNTMVAIYYMDGNYAPEHRDSRYDSEGNFIEGDNSQQKDTPVLIMTIGDPRELTMQLMRHPYTPSEKLINDSKPIKVDHPDATQTFTLSHGSLFVLAPADEQTAIRPHFDKVHPTFWFHHVKKIKEHSDFMSTGLVFRVSTHQKKVMKTTGQLSLSPQKFDEIRKRKHYWNCQNVLMEYLSPPSLHIKENKDTKIKSTYEVMKRKYAS